jgi:hypothetical protein
MQNAYAEEVAKHLTDLGLYVDVDTSSETLPKKIRNGEIAQYNFILGQYLCFRATSVTDVPAKWWANKSSTAAQSTCATATTPAARVAARSSSSKT